MRCGFITAHDRGQWDAYVGRAGGDIYHSAGYHLAYEARDQVASAFWAEFDGRVLFYPYFVRAIRSVAGEAIASGLADIETVYGYAGPVANPDFDERARAEAWGEFDAWCRATGIVCEFIRFHPLLATHRFASPACDLVEDRTTVAIRTDIAPDALLASYSSEQRNRLRKAVSSGVEVEREPTSKSLDEFIALYELTMRRRDAERRYFFDRAYYGRLVRALDESVGLYVARISGRMVAAALFLFGRDTVHYHLGGSLEEARAAAPNNLLFHAAALDAGKAGKSWLHLGGGRTPDPSDSLLRFKGTFSRLRVPFFLGKRVHNAGAYEMLVDRWRARSGDAGTPRYFQLYRL